MLKIFNGQNARQKQQQRKKEGRDGRSRSVGRDRTNPFSRGDAWRGIGGGGDRRRRRGPAGRLPGLGRREGRGRVRACARPLGRGARPLPGGPALRPPGDARPEVAAGGWGESWRESWRGGEAAGRRRFRWGHPRRYHRVEVIVSTSTDARLGYYVFVSGINGRSVAPWMEPADTQ